jgi:hypothetical protein
MTLRVVWLALLAASAPAAQTAVWEAGNPIRSEEISLERRKLADFTIRQVADRYFAAIAPSNDDYRRAAFVIRLEKPPAGQAWLTAEYLDRGYALISISPAAPQTAQWGVARMNTGKLRRAVFRLPESSGRPLRIYGIELLRALRVTDVQSEIDAVPGSDRSVRCGAKTAPWDRGEKPGLPTGCRTR